MQSANKKICSCKGQFLKTSEIRHSEHRVLSVHRRPMNDYKTVEGDDGWKVQREEKMPAPFLTSLPNTKKACSKRVKA